MSDRKNTRAGTKSGVLAGLATLLLAGTAAMVPATASATSYSLLTTIAVPSAGAVNPNPGGTFTSFDISFFDPLTRLDYVADRSNAAIDIFSGTTLSFVGRAGGFTGQQATTSVSGPDGVVVANNGTTVHQLFGGDGNSTLKSFSLTTPTAPVLTATIPTGGVRRVDEMAYSPTTNLVLVANNADTPAFGTLVNATTGAIVHGNIVIPGAAPGDGLEQPVWNPNTGSFFISVPQFAGTGAGGVAEIRTDGTVGRIINFSTLGLAGCSPAGLVVGSSGNLLVGCATLGTQTVLLNPITGTIVKTFTDISGSDELYFDPASDNFFVTGTSGGGRVFDVISDATNTILQTVPLNVSVNAHSISVDPGNGYVFVPLEANNTAGTNLVCTNGCIAVYAQNVPEPGTTPLVITALAGLAAAGTVRRRLMRA